MVLHLKLVIKDTICFMFMAVLLTMPIVVNGAEATMNGVRQIIQKEAQEYNRCGLEYANHRQFKLAIEQYDLAIALDMKSAEYYINRGNAFFNDRQFDKAIENFTKVIELQPGNYRAYLARGNGYAANKQPDKAMSDLRCAVKVTSDAIRRNPKEPEKYFDRAMVYLLLYDVDKAIADYSRVLERNHQNDTAYVNRGAAYMMAYEFDNAIADFSKAIVLNRNNVQAFLYCGDTYFYWDKMEEAIASYTEVIKLQPDNAEAYAKRSIAYMMKDEKDAAMRDGKKAETLDKELTRSIMMRMTFSAISYSHINGNVPNKCDFDGFLLRDIRAYFNVGQQAVVKYQFLRKGPEQVGVSCPEFYFWVEVNDKGVQHVGAMQVYVLDKKKFIVTNYVSREEIEKDFSEVYKKFPLPICEKIASKIRI